MAPGSKKRPRRSFTQEFKAGAVRLVLDEGKTVSQVGRDLDVAQSVIGNWVKQARADRSDGKPGLTRVGDDDAPELREGGSRNECPSGQGLAGAFGRRAREGQRRLNGKRLPLKRFPAAVQRK
jgi:transposase